MSDYKHLLQHNDTLDALCDRMNNVKQLELLICDLIYRRYERLIEFGYIRNSRFESANESAYIWLTSIPFYIRRVSRNVFDRVFIDSIDIKDWQMLSLILMITSANKYGVSENILKKIHNYKLPAIIELKVCLTLIHLQNEKGLSPEILIEWEAKINIKQKPHLIVILISLLIKYDPRQALNHITNLDRLKVDMPNEQIRLIMMSKFKDLTLSYFDSFNVVQYKRFERAEYYISWVQSITTTWIRELISDIFQLKKLADLKHFLQNTNEDFILILSQPSVNQNSNIKIISENEVKEFEYTYKKIMKNKAKVESALMAGF